MSDCRTCSHNTYRAIRGCEWVFCAHPTTISKSPRVEAGDPAWVNFMTADVPVSRIAELDDCSAYQLLGSAE